MRALVWVPLAVLLTAAAGWAVCRAAHLNVHAGDMAIAAGAALAAGLLAAVPMAMARGASQLGVSQAALVGTAVHLFVLTAAAGVVSLGKLAGPAFLYWLMAFYAATLVVVVTAFARAIRAAPMATAVHKPAG
jgi:hypothetical protein